MPKNWIRSAIKHPGALHAKAQRAGLLKDGKLTPAAISAMEQRARSAGDDRTLKQINLARTLAKMRADRAGDQ